MVQRFAHGLFGGHVRRGSRSANALLRAGAVDHAGQPEIHNFGHAAIGDDDVRGFNVAMDDMTGVRFGEPARYLTTDVESLRERERTAANLRRQRFTVVKSHDDE